MRRPDLLERARALPGLAEIPPEPPVHLVGGAVRDLLRDREPRDVDLVVEGDPDPVATALGGAVAAHERFGTASAVVDGRRYDLVRARAETYPAPGALPEVFEGTLDDDLHRRDFTVNTFALALADGELRWAGRAEEDLEAGLLRVLHPLSFVDDPTRLLRLARYAGRLGFAIEPETERLARGAVAGGALGTVSPTRIGAELNLLAREPDPVAAFDALRALGIDEAIASGFGIRDAEHVRRALAELPEDGRPDVVVLAAALRGVNDPAELLGRLGRPASDVRLVCHALEPAELDGASPGETAERLRSLEQAALLAAGGSAEAARWLEETRHVELEITGDDLRAAGVPEGPELGAALRAARRAKRDGDLPGGREAELAAVRARLGA
jgi:tRNA nucleotidyltransferase (CCA-adding enzyme)